MKGRRHEVMIDLMAPEKRGAADFFAIGREVSQCRWGVSH